MPITGYTVIRMKKIYFWLLLAILIIFLGLLLWPNNKKKTENKNTVSKTEESYSPFFLETVKEIDWQNKKFDEVKSELIKIRLKKIDGNELTRIGKVLGYNDSYKQYLYWNEEMARVEFGKNISKVTEVKVPNRISKEDMVTKFKKIINQINDDNDFELEVKEIKYVQFLFPWWIGAEINSANGVSIEGVYKYKGKEVWGYWGNPIKGTMKMDGELIKLEMYLPPIVEKKENDKTLVNSEILKRLPVDQNKIIKIDGGEDYELAETEPIISKVVVNEVKAILIFDQRNGWLWPSYLLNGEAESDRGKLNLKLVNTESSKK